MAWYEEQTRRENGVYYTPRKLADRLLEPFSNKPVPSAILDPACGDGSLLSSAKEIYLRSGKAPKPAIYGCDISPDLKKLGRLRPKRIWVKDFLALELERRFDLVVLNPPYVRHHRIPSNIKHTYHIRARTICPLPKSSDLWAYFVVRAVEVLNDGGSIAAILPWAFLQADYSRILRGWLAERFEVIEVMAVSSRQFEHAEERIVLVWLSGKGRSTQSITLRNVTKPSQNVPWHKLSWSDWTRSRVVMTTNGSIDDILKPFSDKGFISFREVGDAKIGTVTGADSFFIVDRGAAIEMGLKEINYQKILRSLRDVRGFFLNGNCPDKVLMNFPSKPKMQQVVEYLEKGRKERIDQRAHCLRRNPWYTIPRIDPPDAFFPYRISHTPYLVVNSPKYLCTNSIHAIKWRNLNRRQIEWVQISLLSVPGQLSLEAHGKTYGSGVMKIELNALGSALVTTGHACLPRKQYKQINELLCLNRRDAASEIATNVVQELCNIDPKTMQVCKSALLELKNRRLVVP